MYDVYRRGYSTLPDLQKLTSADVFERDTSESALIQSEKQSALRDQTCFVESAHDPSLDALCAAWIKENYPRNLQGTSYRELVQEADEDFLIHRIVGARDYLSSAHVCFPSHWLPEEKIGRSFAEIHRPVPMNLKASRRIVEAIVQGGIFERFVWSVVYENRYNFHPRCPPRLFSERSPTVLVKVERQVTVGFPEQNCCLFILRQYLIQERDLDKPVLAQAIDTMTAEQKEYKGLSECGPLLQYLRS